MRDGLPTGPGTLRVTGFTKRHGRRTVLEDASFSIRAGEVLGVIGPNGAGKTTLFECLAGVRPKTAGALHHDDRPVDPPLAHALLFYVADGIAPWPARRVRWALDFVTGFFRGRAELRESVVADLALGPLLDARLGSLSKGERKRVLLAIGLLTPQPVLLVDEPFDGLDLRQSREVAGVLRAHAARGRTLVLSIHQIAEAARLCDRFVLLSAGRVRAEGTIAEIAARAAKAAPEAPPADSADAARIAVLEEAFLALA